MLHVSLLKKQSKCAISSVHYLSSMTKNTIVLFGDSNTWGYNPDVCNKQSSRFAFSQRWTTYVDELLHHKYHIAVEGLNARTTVFDDPISPCDSEYDCNGRRFLTTILHSHKPISAVVLALGTNDLKSKFHASAYDIIGGVRALIRDVQKATDIGAAYTLNSKGENESNVSSSQCNLLNEHIYYTPPKILVLGPPVIHHTHFNRVWGFDEGVEGKSRKVSALLSLVCKELNIGYINLAHVTKVSERDGVHFPLSEQHTIGKAVANKLHELLK